MSGVFDLIGANEQDALFPLGTLDDIQKRALLGEQPLYILEAYRIQLNNAGANIANKNELVDAIIAGKI